MPPPLDTKLRVVLERFPHVETAILFGSLASGTAHADSDLDLAVQADQPLSASAKQALITAFAEAEGRAVDLVDLRTAGEPLLGQILRHGRRLKGSDATYAELMRRHVFDAADFLPYVTRMLEERNRQWMR